LPFRRDSSIVRPAIFLTLDAIDIGETGAAAIIIITTRAIPRRRAAAHKKDATDTE
tara:strand:+ start:2907 stop:3074 length:168 start_codon:yes stop_codon:yes gene_type:complete